MRFATWNCKGALRRKLERILPEGIDVLVAPEAEQPLAFNNVIGAPPLRSSLWTGDSQTKGIAILSFGDYSLTVHHDFDPAHKYILPVEVHGPTSFLLFAVWTVPGPCRNWYIEPLISALGAYRHLLDHPRVIWAGDFNQNAVWDEGDSPYNFRPFVEELNAAGLRSLYHATTGSELGREPDPTFHLHHHENKGHHIDYVFASDPLIEAGAGLRVGKYADWHSHSDHMPLLCTFDHPADAG